MNDVLGPRQFVIGQSNKVIIESVENGVIFADLAKDRQKRKMNEEAPKDGEVTSQKKKQREFDVGSVYKAK